MNEQKPSIIYSIARIFLYAAALVTGFIIAAGIGGMI